MIDPRDMTDDDVPARRWSLSRIRGRATHFWGEPLETLTGGADVALFAIVVGVLSLAFCRFPHSIATTGLDDSWAQVLSYAAANGWQAGEDYLFSYGPWGWVVLPAYQAETFGARIILELILKLAVAIWVAREAFSLGGAVKPMLFLLLAGALLRDEGTLLMGIYLVGRRLAERPDLPVWRGACGLAFLAFVSHTKHVDFLFALGVLGVVTLDAWWRLGNRKRAAGLAAAYGLLWLVFWVAAG